MRLLLIAGLFAAAAPAFAEVDIDEMAANIAASHAIYERNHATARAALAEKHKAEQAAIDRRCSKLGGARVGMDAAAVSKSCWGQPTRINTTTTARGTHEQWVYSGGYLYLDNGIVTSIQTSR